MWWNSMELSTPNRCIDFSNFFMYVMVGKHFLYWHLLHDMINLDTLFTSLFIWLIIILNDIGLSTRSFFVEYSLHNVLWHSIFHMNYWIYNIGNFIFICNLDLGFKQVVYDGMGLLGLAELRNAESEFYHTKSHDWQHLCDVNYVVSSIIM
jgi:hypothetical protein